nr:putative mating type 1-1-2 protein [Ceratocystis fimbriata]WRK64973.1 putative mating-type 1-1-2 protein [Ceratocystis eucalypticola]WRK64977.1 putative mating-type 1-1-2 protein [Ceratocystis eucalypticola]WRK64985.1 putative mating-type 1-1-2 protein [Ceratocystis manginecans]WRK64989.1 putative mating-type 1-1-2 protein [Ceratocystis manginecans]
MSREFDKVAPARLEREIPLTLSSQSIQELHYEIFTECLRRRRKNPMKYAKFFADHLSKDAVKEVMVIIDLTMYASSQPIVSAVRALAGGIKLDHNGIVHRLLHAWNKAAMPFIFDVKLSRGISLQGYRAIVLTTNMWKPMAHLQTAERHAILAANSATVAIVAALIIVNWLLSSEINPASIEGMMEPYGVLGTEVFLRFMWDQVLPPLDILKNFPGRELGLRAGSSIKFDDDLSLQISVKNIYGRVGWRDLPYLHPAYRVYGSSWSKFFRNRGQSMFFKGDYTDAAYWSRPITFAIPTKTLEWISKLKEEYALAARKLGDVPLMSFETVAGLSGEPYPNISSNKPSVETKRCVVPLEVYQPAGIGQVCRYPITDLNGNLTLNFCETLMACDPDGPIDPPQNTDFLAPPFLNRPSEGLMLFKCRKYEMPRQQPTTSESWGESVGKSSQ